MYETHIVNERAGARANHRAGIIHTRKFRHPPDFARVEPGLDPVGFCEKRAESTELIDTFG